MRVLIWPRALGGKLLKLKISSDTSEGRWGRAQNVIRNFLAKFKGQGRDREVLLGGSAEKWWESDLVALPFFWIGDRVHSVFDSVLESQESISAIFMQYCKYLAMKKRVERPTAERENEA